MANKKYSNEFKDFTVQLALNSGESVLKIGKDLGVTPKTIDNWITTYKKLHNIPIDGINSKISSTSKETLQEENKRLRAEAKVLKQERDILKKAAAYFAKEVL